MMNEEEIRKAIRNKLPVKCVKPDNPENIYTGTINRDPFGKLCFGGKNGNKRGIIVEVEPQELFLDIIRKN